MSKKYKLSDLAYALDNAAEFLETEETTALDDAEAQHAANLEAARRIRNMASKEWAKAVIKDAS